MEKSGKVKDDKHQYEEQLKQLERERDNFEKKLNKT